MKKVLILGHGTRSFLSVIRSLGRKGIIVHAGNPVPEDLALHSKYIRKYFHVPPFSEPERWKSEIISIVEKERYDLVIPTDDAPIILLRQIIPEIGKYSRVYLLDNDAYTVTCNKLQTYALCRSLGIRVPEFLVLSENDDPGTVLEAFHFPLIIKPVSSFSPDHLERKNLVRIARDTAAFISILRELFLQNSTLIIQEYFEGAGTGIEVIANRGEILVAFQHIRIHEKRIWGFRNIGGASTYRKSQQLDPLLMSQAVKIIRSLDYTGVAMLEFRKNPERNESVLIEINGRFWGSLPLAVAAGADFPYYLFQLLVENKKTFPQAYTKNLFCRSLTEDIYWMYDECSSFASLKDRLRFFGRTMGEFFNIILLRERNDTLVLDDFEPGIKEIGALILLPVSKLNRKLRGRLQASPWYRTIRSRNFTKAVRDAKNILFVCRGNICRSPFAEHYSRTLFNKDIRLGSCGYVHQDGRTSPPEAISAASTFGVDLSDHRAQHITGDMVRNSDMIIIFDEENYRMLLSRYPREKNRIWFLSEICPEIPLHIGDPFKKDADTYQNVYSVIAQCIDRIGQSLRAPQDRKTERNR